MPFTIHRASAALPAAGAYDTSATLWELGPHTPEISVAMTYTAGAAGGYPGFRVLWRIAEVTAMLDTVNNGTITTSGANASIDEYVGEVDCNSLLDGSSAKATRVLKVPPGATHVQIQPREVGVTATPGALEVRLARSV